ncbi:hypothetical protein AWM75_06535 [Aerococcus urinaehominis]|uniref:Cell division protein FtsL n=1 Tax=Aerococcus urinaehominis TaxID=128944 RepID=A0A0X8FLX9_9LACT|nr:cell division protein FtsL [Aerococcus urinaehominis]AMB99657.1 hypothetical protein AWM75_06535 [Aerococcus urinaehominis]SDL89221.1 cell division protein FtsL [Aerococcus urinaehominis]
MAIFALERDKTFIFHAMPAEKAIPDQTSDQGDSRDATKHDINELDRAYEALPSNILTGKNWLTLAGFFAFSLLCLWGAVGSQANASKLEQDLSQLQGQAQELSVKKGHLSQEVHELSTYDRVMEIAEDYGLTMNEDNIRNVEK